MFKKTLYILVAACLFVACSTPSEKAKMQKLLEQTLATNRSGELFTTDSLTQRLGDYFDRFGTSNEQMQARYLLGRSLFDMGEAPKSLQAYYDAIEAADTTRTDCDFYTLQVVYGQMARIFHEQNLPNDELWAVQHYINYARKVGDELYYVEARSQLVRPYWTMGDIEGLLQVVEESRRDYLRLGDKENAADELGVAFSVYTVQGKLDKAREALGIFEKESGLVDKNGYIVKGREHYYVMKAFYLLAVGKVDSAELYLRRAQTYGYQSDVSKGLLQVYRKRNNVDSVYHYSLLFEAAQDSLHKQMSAEAISQMSSLYNYTRSERLAQQEAEKARKAHQWIFIISVAAIAGLVFGINTYRRFQRRRREEIRKFSEALSSARREHLQVQAELKQLKEKDYEKLIADKEQRETELLHTIGELQAAVGRQSAEGGLSTFESSDIVRIFKGKASNPVEHPAPTSAEWRLLDMQVSKDVPQFYEALTKDNALSPLELHTCCLLILGFAEGDIANLTESAPQAITTAKTRANQKLFSAKGSRSLKSNLIRLLNHT